jgi:alpha-glucosidase
VPASEATRTDDGVAIDLTVGLLELRFPRPGQVSVGWNHALLEPSVAVVAGAGAAVAELAPDGTGWRVSAPGIAVVVGSDGSLAYCDAAGDVRRRDEPPVAMGEGWQLRTRYRGGASLHGLGGRSTWRLDGRSWRCWNTDPGGAWLPGDDPLSVTTPVYAALDDRGAVHCFTDNPYDATIAVAGAECAANFTGGPMRWHVTIGSLPECLAGFTALTGRPATPPRWALGHHQARWGYASSDAIRTVRRGFAEHGLPLSALHLDIDHMDRFRDFTTAATFDDLGALAAELAEGGVATVVIVDAGIARAEDYPQYADGLRRGAFCLSPGGEVFTGQVWPGPTVFPDFTDPAVRTWWGEQFRFYTERGVAGFWHDMNEPVCFAEEGGETTLPLDTRHDLDGFPGDHRAAHNLYGLQMCRATYDGLRRLQPDRRPFLFSRSGWAGMQRYGGHWSGDVGTDWTSLGATIHQAFAFGLSGVGYYGPDIGGFTGDPTPELFTRWFQLASFLPFFRTHCAFTAPPREPWEWGTEVMERLRAALLRRYRLLPYWYTLALQAARDGAPYVRPLAWCDAGLREVDDEFLLGNDVLVAPVLAPGATTRTVVLPAGTWCHGETGQLVRETVQVAVGPGDTPWFVRAGAVLPTEEDGRLVLLAAPPLGEQPASGGALLNDAGDGWAAPHEERYRTELVGDSLVVHREIVRDASGGYPEVEVRSVDGRPARLG